MLKMECTECKFRKQLAIKRCKHFELGGDKKKKVRCVFLKFKTAKSRKNSLSSSFLCANECLNVESPGQVHSVSLINFSCDQIFGYNCSFRFSSLSGPDDHVLNFVDGKRQAGERYILVKKKNKKNNDNKAR